MRVALVHDWLTGLRGGERVLHELTLLYPNADLFTLVHVQGTTTPEIERLTIHASPLSRIPGVARHYRKLLPLYPWAIERFDLGAYDLVVSCSHAVAKSVRIAPGAVHVCYCLTPMRYIWDQADAYLGRGLKRAVSAPLVGALRRFDVRTSTPERVSRFVAISRAVAGRIHAHYGRESAVVHPPVDTTRFVPRASAARDDAEGFYFMLGGFVPYKREELAIEAFRTLDRTLLVAGDGPTRRKLEKRAPSNVRFLGRLSDVDLADHYQRCRALVYPQEEDFGITAVEAQAAGRPVIAFGKGGARDTIRPPEDAKPGRGPTGILFDTQTAAALAEALGRFERSEAAFVSSEIRTFAEGFSIGRFRTELTREIETALRTGAR